MKFVWIGHLLISPTNLDTIRINLRKSHYKWSKAISTEMNLVAMEMKSFQLKWFFFLNASGPHAGPLLISPTNLDTWGITLLKHLLFHLKWINFNWNEIPLREDKKIVSIIMKSYQLKWKFQEKGKNQLKWNIFHFNWNKFISIEMKFL